MVVVTHTLSELRLPSLEESIDEELVEEVQRRTEWTARRVGVIGSPGMPLARFRAGSFALLTALAYPHADIDALVLCNDFNTYLFYVDDQAEEDENYGKRPQLLESYFEGHVLALRSGTAAWDLDPGTQLLQSIRRRLHSRATAGWLARFAQNLEEYLLRGTLVGAQNWTDGVVPAPDAYAMQRAWDSAVYCSQDLAEVAGGVELPSLIRGNALFQHTRSLVTRVVAFTNDLVSYQKEVHRHESPNNLVHVLMVHEGLSLDAAIGRVIDMVNADVDKFEELTSRIDAETPEASRALRAYRSSQRAWMAGNLLWSLRSGRYVDPKSPFVELRTPAEDRMAG